MFKTICDISNESIIITDQNVNIIYANDALCKMSGYSREELIGQNPRILKSGIQDASFYKDMWDTIHRGEIWHGEFANRKKDGSIYWELATITAINEDGKTFYIGIMQDITYVKNLEADIRKMRKKIQALSQASHDMHRLAEST